MKNFFLFIAILAIATSLFSQKAIPPHPNIILNSADDLGYGDVGCMALKV